MSQKILTLVTGGARSGKSSFGESILINESRNVLYIATAQAFDQEMKDRIKKHQQSRPQEWITYEGYKNFNEVLAPYASEVNGIFLDCVTIMTTNLLLAQQVDWDTVSHQQIDEIEAMIFDEFKKLVQFIKSSKMRTVLVTNEVGLGIVPIDRLTRVFRDIAGRVNQYLAREADEVYLVTCGISTKIK
ncbi:bifunctional adenosylcobinamide kinase/adenosylcobinamide-phosphate guanylyltransferase [Alkaliphilus hydrothermalis]|uniref:Adenosylcobinamide kinase n=1 Tax=Alkaliphilus hydrothermalis TaxID=1482730 RepID=A0ABS2NN89_9FIRM|nr:bifunctional adenosylcobinamide kinase/adenosylcobinamide-phosphate guanylyltransferase [Alkaliphilus hydrothermalis]MBM7614416.1 adenosylcobinamide kinase/adenosylcobinamide-phosphate guanylyltransferase [Alkaliphilus hydrothermalis]